MYLYIYIYIIRIYIYYCIIYNISTYLYYTDIYRKREGEGRDGGLSTLCHSCRFACRQRVLKTFPGPSYLRSDDEVV